MPSLRQSTWLLWQRGHRQLSRNHNIGNTSFSPSVHSTSTAPVSLLNCTMDAVVGNSVSLVSKWSAVLFSRPHFWPDKVIPVKAGRKLDLGLEVQWRIVFGVLDAVLLATQITGEMLRHFLSNNMSEKLSKAGLNCYNFRCPFLTGSLLIFLFFSFTPNNLRRETLCMKDGILHILRLLDR